MIQPETFDINDTKNIEIHKIIGVDKKDTKVYFYLLRYIGKAYKVSMYSQGKLITRRVRNGSYFVTFSVDDAPPTVAPIEVTHSITVATKRLLAMVKTAKHPNIEFATIKKTQHA